MPPTQPAADTASSTQLLVANIDFDQYKGKLGIGRLTAGKLRAGQTVGAQLGPDGERRNVQVKEVFIFDNLGRKQVDEATAGEIVMFSGVTDIGIGETLVGINTSLPNLIVSEAIENGIVDELKGYASLRREVKYGKNSRIDILLEEDAKPKCYVEVKNTTMRRNLENGPAEFPDAVTSRGAKHLVELSDMVRDGHRAVMFYLVQREDADAFTVADDIDPTYAEELAKAMKAGVEVVCYACTLSPDEIVVSRKIPVSL